MVLPGRDPPGVTSSKMDAARERSWAEWNQKKWITLADRKAEPFVKNRARRYARLMKPAHGAFASHQGPKVIVRCQDLLSDTIATPVLERHYPEGRSL